jgi:ABC-type molybdenum transport system ATPase subunit/photorepair protein PhrA
VTTPVTGTRSAVTATRNGGIASLISCTCDSCSCCRIRTLQSAASRVDPDFGLNHFPYSDVDLEWHMHEVSDGERRRVQIVSGLMAPWDVLLLDEVSSFTFLLSFFLLLLALLLALL